MADPGLLGNVDYIGVLSGAASGLFSVVMITIYVVIIGSILLLLMYYLKHDYDVRVRLQTREGNIVFNRRGRIVDTGKHMVMKFFMDFKKKVYSAPTKDCIDHTKRGRKVVDVIIDEEGNARYIKVHDIGDSVKFNALDTNERAAYVDEIEKAEKRKTRNILDLIRDLAPLFAVVTIFVLLIIFWGDIAAPFIEVGNNMIGISESFDSMITKLDRVVNVLAKQQVIEYTNQSLSNASAIPPEAIG